MNGLNAQKAIVPLGKKLPITVVIVVKDIADYSNKEIQAIRQYCHDLNIMVESRKFDSYRYNHDRDEIRQLPALHLYVNTKYIQTFYIQGRPYQIIHTAVHNFKRSCEERVARRNGWKNYISRVWGSIRGVFAHKNRLQPETTTPTGPRTTVLRPTPELPPRRYSIGVAPSREAAKSAPASLTPTMLGRRMGYIDMDC